MFLFLSPHYEASSRTARNTIGLLGCENSSIFGGGNKSSSSCVTMDHHCVFPCHGLHQQWLSFSALHCEAKITSVTATQSFREPPKHSAEDSLYYCSISPYAATLVSSSHCKAFLSTMECHQDCTIAFALLFFPNMKLLCFHKFLSSN